LSNKIENIFDSIGDELLIELALNYPKTLFKICSMASLELQLEKEGYDQNISNWGEVC